MASRAKPVAINNRTKTVARRLDDPELYLNRELAWLAFNDRVLKEA